MKLSQADWVIVAAVAFGVVAAILLLLLGQLAHVYSPPVVVSVFLALSVSALTYRFLGGSDGATFKLGPLQLAGTAAVFVGVMWFVNAQMSKQLDIDNSQAKYQEARAKIVALNERYEQLESNLQAATNEINSLEAEGASQLKLNQLGSIDAIRNLDPKSDFAKSLVEMSSSKTGPWREEFDEIKVTVSVAGYLQGRGAAACDDPRLREGGVSLVSLVLLNGENIRSTEPVMVPSFQRVSTEFCGPDRKFDLQVSCALASEIFTKQIVTCSNGNAAWQDGFRNLLPVAAMIPLKKG
ncbi:MAG: hypothetical protein M3Y70_00790 [Pseudomonadota bacterium]|nr:hypothetical protein [Pseudomonadota bacterium]